MLFTTFYFSGTGNTKWTVEQFQQLVILSGHQAKLYSIDSFDRFTIEELRSTVKESDYIGFANPIYGADIPPIMKAFIRLLTDSIRTEKIPIKQIYIINTVGYVNAFGPFQASKLLDRDCFFLIAYVNIRLCNNISTYKHKSKLINDEELKHRKKLAIDELNILIQRLLSSQKYMKGIGPYLLPGILIRKKSQVAIQNNYQSLSVQTETCNQCMLCVNNCPTHCIRFSNQQFEFSSACTACMRCYNFCPTASIRMDGVYTDPKEYFRYKGPK